MTKAALPSTNGDKEMTTSELKCENETKSPQGLAEPEREREPESESELERKRKVSRLTSQKHCLRQNQLLEEQQKKNADLEASNEKLKSYNESLRTCIGLLKLHTSLTSLAQDQDGESDHSKADRQRKAKATMALLQRTLGKDEGALPCATRAKNVSSGPPRQNDMGSSNKPKFVDLTTSDTNDETMSSIKTQAPLSSSKILPGGPPMNAPRGRPSVIPAGSPTTCGPTGSPASSPPGGPTGSSRKERQGCCTSATATTATTTSSSTSRSTRTKRKYRRRKSMSEEPPTKKTREEEKERALFIARTISPNILRDERQQHGDIRHPDRPDPEPTHHHHSSYPPAACLPAGDVPPQEELWERLQIQARLAALIQHLQAHRNELTTTGGRSIAAPATTTTTTTSWSTMMDAVVIQRHLPHLLRDPHRLGMGNPLRPPSIARSSSSPTTTTTTMARRVILPVRRCCGDPPGEVASCE